MKSITRCVSAALVSCLMACGSPQTDKSQLQFAPAAVGAAVGSSIEHGLPLADFFYSVISESIDRSEKDAKMRADRAAFINAMAEQVYQQMNRAASKQKIRPYNVAMCSGDLHCSLTADEGIHYMVKSFRFQDRYYSIWAFRGGKLDNPTAGGWDNWIVMGCHNKTWSGHGTVTFSNTTWLGGKPEDGRNGCLK